MQQNILDFFEFIYNRQLIWHKRNIEELPYPWSDDKIFQKFKFCNIYRELDSGTKIIKDFIIGGNISAEDKLLNIIAYRFFNKCNTLEKLFRGGLDCAGFDFKEQEKWFDKCKEEGAIFSDAYLVSSHPYNHDYRPKDKHVQLLFMLDDLKKNIAELLTILKSSKAAEGLSVIENNIAMAGPFLSGQILLDCTYSRDASGVQDIVNYTSDDFLIVGPGAKWGLELIFGEKLSQKKAQEKCKYLYSLQSEYFGALKGQGRDFLAIAYKDKNYKSEAGYVSLHDIQNSLCEYRKYLRLKTTSNSKKRYFKVS